MMPPFAAILIIAPHLTPHLIEVSDYLLREICHCLCTPVAQPNCWNNVDVKAFRNRSTAEYKVHHQEYIWGTAVAFHTLRMFKDKRQRINRVRHCAKTRKHSSDSARLATRDWSKQFDIHTWICQDVSCWKLKPCQKTQQWGLLRDNGSCFIRPAMIRIN